MGTLGVSWEAFGSLLELLEGSLAPLRGSWEPLEGFLEPLGGFLEPFGGFLEPLGRFLGVIWVILGAAGCLLGPLGALLGHLGGVLGSSWEHFGGILVLFGRYFGAFEASLKRFAEILKNLEKHCKVLQKLRSGGSAIHGTLSLESMLGPTLMLSWLVRGQVEAKRGKLTPLGGLRGTNLELKGALGAPREAPREPPSAIPMFGVLPRGLNFWLGGPP